MSALFIWLAFAAVQLAATMSPGPAFIMTVRNSLAFNRKTGIMTALGLALGVTAHVIFVMLGLSVLIAKSTLILTIIKYAGAAYLIYIGTKAIITSRPTDNKNIGERYAKKMKGKELSSFQALRTGFLTNLLNPKAVIFFTAVFTQFIDENTSLSLLSALGVTATIIEGSWFTLVSIFLTNKSIKKHFVGMMHWFERICGGLMIALGLKLALSKISS